MAEALLLSLKDAAAFIGVTEWQMRGLITRGEIKHVMVADKYYVRRATLIRWVERAEE